MLLHDCVVNKVAVILVYMYILIHKCIFKRYSKDCILNMCGSWVQFENSKSVTVYLIPINNKDEKLPSTMTIICDLYGGIFLTHSYSFTYLLVCVHNYLSSALS